MEYYENKYKETLERAREQLEGAKVFDYKDEQIAHDIRTTIYEIFPELNESEDDRIRKDIINTIERYIEHVVNDENYAPDAKDFLVKELKGQIAWLEKQCEQKPAWSEEDENEIVILKAYIHSKDWSDSHVDRALGIVDELVNKLKSLRSQNGWKPSDEQMNIMQYLCAISSHPNPNVMPIMESLYDDLKKLREE